MLGLLGPDHIILADAVGEIFSRLRPRSESSICDGILGMMRLARIIHDGSWRNRAVATRDRRVEPRGREAYLKQYVDRPNGEPACLGATPDASRLVAAANPRLQQKRS